MLVDVGVQAQPQNYIMLVILVVYTHFIVYVYGLLLDVSTYFELPHYRVKPVYESQTIGAHHGGRP